MNEMKTQRSLMNEMKTQNLASMDYQISKIKIHKDILYHTCQYNLKTAYLVIITLFSKLTDNKTKYQRLTYVTTTELQCLTFGAVRSN
jgi:hypothetical protein